MEDKSPTKAEPTSDLTSYLNLTSVVKSVVMPFNRALEGNGSVEGISQKQRKSDVKAEPPRNTSQKHPRQIQNTTFFLSNPQDFDSSTSSMPLDRNPQRDAHQMDDSVAQMPHLIHRTSIDNISGDFEATAMV